MTTPMRQNLLGHLRALDEHFGRIEPDRAFEPRLRVRLEAAAEAKKPRTTTIAWLRKSARPMAVAIAACSVLILSLSDEPPPARSGLALPNVPDGSVNPVETPMGERIEPAVTNRDEYPEAPHTNPPEELEPTPLDQRQEPLPVFPAQPDADTPPERTFFDGRNLAPAPFPNAPKSSSRETPGAFGFWSPGGAISIDSQPRPSTTSGNWSFGGAPVRTKLPHASPPPRPRSACATVETWKERASLDCEESGMILSDIVYLFPCGEGLFRDEEHECVEAPPDEESCTTDTISDGDGCVDPGQFKTLAYEACKLAGKDLVDLWFVSGDCGWKVREAKYTCCPFVSDPSPPPPPVCQVIGMGDGVTCMDLGSLKQEAFELCTKLGQTLTNILPAMNVGCPDNQTFKAEVTCCVYK